MADFSDLRGKVLQRFEVNENGDVIYIETLDDRKYRLYHSQDCCEHVYIEAIVGDVNDLVGYEILLAEESVKVPEKATHDDSETWTFYKLATIKGYVDLRWVGSSNGYYSERVDFEELE